MGTILSLLGIGVVVLIATFLLLAGVHPADAATATTVAAALALVLGLRYLRLDHELRHQGGDSFLRDLRNRQRERRGF